jgi:hypothetical protein
MQQEVARRPADDAAAGRGQFGYHLQHVANFRVDHVFVRLGRLDEEATNACIRARHYAKFAREGRGGRRIFEAGYVSKAPARHSATTTMRTR